MKITMEYDLENYILDIENMQRYDDEYFYHLCSLYIQIISIEKVNNECMCNVNALLNNL